MPLNPKQRAFVREYLTWRNGKQAAIKAGYSERSAEVTASKLLRVPKVAEAVAAGEQKAAAKAEVDLDELLRELKRMALSDIGQAFDESNNLLDVHAIPEPLRRCIAAIEVEERVAGHGEDAAPYFVKKVKLWDKGQALDKLLRYLGAYKDHEDEDSERPINIRIVLGPKDG